MIFLTVGTHPRPFDRLTKGIDNALEEGSLQPPVFGQIGCGNYMPRHYKWTRFLEFSDFGQYVRKCSLMICHGGAGSIITGLTLKKKMLVMPRLKRFGEHLDDHQLDLVYKLHSQRKIVIMLDLDELPDSLAIVRSLSGDVESSRGKLVQFLGCYLAEQISTPG